MTDEKAEVSSEELSVDALVEQLTKERDEFKDIALRVQAEFENYRKRSATQLIDESDRNAFVGSAKTRSRGFKSCRHRF